MNAHTLPVQIPINNGHGKEKILLQLFIFYSPLVMVCVCFKNVKLFVLYIKIHIGCFIFSSEFSVCQNSRGITELPAQTP